jgi:hypothetical protein
MDLLLLNCSNLAWRPIYPYAFVQVSEVARRFGLQVERLDLLGVDHWEERLGALVSRKRPRMVGIHLRQGDSIDLSDYERTAHTVDTHFRSYFPVEDSRRLVRLLRGIDPDLPIVMGGFGFTTHARKLASHLEIDLGVRGCPDGFFAAFEQVLAGRALEQVPGLVHRAGASWIYNDQHFAAPAREREYTDTIVAELKAFYGPALAAPNPPTVAVEVARGCPFQCYFCTEPDVKGRRIDWREPDVVEAELEFLLGHGLRNFWFICSELNIGGTGFVLNLAERVLRLAERFPGPQIRWSGYSLPSLEREELELLNRAGYSGAMNDILSLDDDNLRAARVPYRSRQAVVFLKSMLQTRAAPAAVPAAAPASASCGSPDAGGDAGAADAVKFTASTPSQYAGLISLFLGNAHVGPKTIARTLAVLDREGLAGLYDQGYVIPSTRVFDIGRTSAFVDRPSTVSYTRTGEAPPDAMRPTFHFPELLIQRLGSKEAVLAFFGYVTSTLMSRSHERERGPIDAFLADRLDWVPAQALLQAFKDAPRTAGGEPDRPALRARLLASAQQQDQAHAAGLQAWLDGLFEHNQLRLQPVITLFGAELFEGHRPAASAYRFARAAYRAASSVQSLRDLVAAAGDPLAQLYGDHLVWRMNLHIEPAYKDLLFEDLA